MGKLGTMSLEKKKRSRDAFEDKEKSKKESKTFNVDISQFKFRIREGGVDGEASEGTAVDGAEAKDRVRETTSADTPGSRERRKHDVDPQDTPGLLYGKHIGHASQEEAKEIPPGSSASELKPSDQVPSMDVGSTVPGTNTPLQDVKDDAIQPLKEDISFLPGGLNDEDSFQSDPGVEDCHNEEVTDGFPGQNDSQEYQYGLEIYEDTIAEGPTAVDDDEDKEPLVSGLFMDLDEGDKEDEKS